MGHGGGGIDYPSTDWLHIISINSTPYYYRGLQSHPYGRDPYCMHAQRPETDLLQHGQFA